MVLFSSIGFSTQCFKCTSHTQQEAEGNGDEDGGDNGDSGEVTAAEVTGERLGDDGE